MRRRDPGEEWRLLELCERAMGGDLDEEGRAELESRLRRDPGARALAARALLQHGELRFDGQLARDLARDDVPLSAPSIPVARRRWTVVALAAAAVALAGLGLVLALRPGPDPTVATLVRARQCQWAGSTLPTAEGSRVGAGVLELAEGLATLRFDSGAEVVLEAPATIEIVDAMQCRLRRGTLMADVPPAAKGFTVDTRSAKVVDYGTRFGVSAAEDGQYMVQVLEGLVEVNDRPGNEVRTLRGGQSVDRGLLKGRLHPQVPEFEPSRWRPEGMVDEGDGWQVISTAFGRGKDACIQSNGGVRNLGRDPFFRVKRSSLQADLNRKGYVAFDLARLQGRRLADAELVLSIDPSDLGFASLVPDSSFAVFGVSDESQDEWDEDGLSWAAAPAHDAGMSERHLPRPDQAVFLGRFRIAQGVNRGTCSLRDRALADFLRRDSNGLVTLIICRETDETAKGGLVHAFASKENPRNTPPLLRVKAE